MGFLDFLTLLISISAFIVLAVLSLRLWRNLRFLRWAAQQTILPTKPPFVSVLVPARNEASNITACIESLLSQTYPHYEIIALNDQSSDDTGDQLDRLAAQHPKLRVIHGTSAPPLHWNGKSYACHRLSSQAAGEWLLFTDADTVHSPDSLRSGMAQAQALGVEMLSMFPRQRTATWSERLMVPFVLGFLTLVGLDFRALWQGQSKRVAANGQYLLVRAESYRNVGGHSAIYTALVDDFALAQQFRQKRRRIALVDGTALVTCRMYRNWREVWNGFSKNILLALATSPTHKRPVWQIPLFAWGYAALFILPYPLLFLPVTPLGLLVLAWLWTLRAAVALHSRRSILEAPFTSLAALGVMAMSLHSLYRRWRHKGIEWKGRVYS